MKALKTLLLFLCFSITAMGCVAKYTIPVGGTNDLRFVGQWEGKHFNEKGGYWRKWEQNRHPDGTYKLVLKYYDKSDKFLNRKVETGYWWLQDGLFHEIAPSRMSKPESYKFEFTSNEQIEFSSVQIDKNSDEKVGYSFIDKKVKE
ncbi:hypothetical protein [Desulfopila inferna]|uniref:hypothetical protein n=1 Tax=Desulfopila inferna TaxID=468528 RepID=UPI001965C127|nr:hypothetical protein [Desulfopila inferna]MBM9606250.1 hypothetical protein [Desulfopila inferna]